MCLSLPGFGNRSPSSSRFIRSPEHRGSVNACKYAHIFLSRARQQATMSLRDVGADENMDPVTQSEIEPSRDRKGAVCRCESVVFDGAVSCVFSATSKVADPCSR